MLVFDSHCDSPSQMHRLRDFAKDNALAHNDFPKMRKGGVSAAYFALYIPRELKDAEATSYALELLSDVYEQVEASQDSVDFAFNSEELESNYKDGLTTVMISMENGSPIQRNLNLLRMFYRMGVTCMTLTHNGDNEIADSVAGNGRWGGLSPFGREVVAEMNRLGMIIDIAHASDDTVADCLEVSKAPIVSTHSCCRDLCHHRRNLTDNQIKAIAAKGGVVQVAFCPSFLTDDFDPYFDNTEEGRTVDAIEEEFIKDPSNKEKVAAWNDVCARINAMERPSLKYVADHIDHVVKVAGIDHVGIGSDFDGITATPAGLENSSMLPALFDELRSRGYSEEEVSKIAGGNFVRVMKEVERIAATL